MSPFVVPSAHIDVVVPASIHFGLIGLPDPDRRRELGAGLWAENHRSVDYRYDDDEQPPSPVAPPAEVVLDPVAVVEAVDCCVRQSREHPQWTDGAAALHCARLRSAAIRGLAVEAPGPSSGQPHPVGCDDWLWGIEDSAEVCAHSPASIRDIR